MNAHPGAARSHRKAKDHRDDGGEQLHGAHQGAHPAPDPAHPARPPRLAGAGVGNLMPGALASRRERAACKPRDGPRLPRAQQAFPRPLRPRARLSRLGDAAQPLPPLLGRAAPAARPGAGGRRAAVRARLLPRPRPAVYHYAPREHAVELRAELSEAAWAQLSAPLPAGALLVGLTSIHWRESWKYGERAFRYCQHDAGHAVGALAVAAAGLGWEARLSGGVPDRELAALLGVRDRRGIEAEHPECLLLVAPPVPGLRLEERPAFALPAPLLEEIASARWNGEPNRLSKDHHPWPVIDEVALATEKTGPPGEAFWEPFHFDNSSLTAGDESLPLRQLIQQRRSAVALDGRTGITRDAFYQILLKAMPGASQVPFTAVPWRPRIDLLLFVHRVEGVEPGLYALLRDPSRQQALRAALHPKFLWVQPPRCPDSLPLFLLEAGDARAVARRTSCNQEIAADGAFAAAMLAEFRAPLEQLGPWFYRRLHWETGVVGQLLYLEAEASGIRATGIGCFFDDATHLAFGLAGDHFQVLYHFTMGGAVDDPRLQTAPPYALP